MVIERPNVLWCMKAQCLNAPHQRLPENIEMQYLKFSVTERDATGERQRLPCQDCVGRKNGTFCSTTHILRVTGSGAGQNHKSMATCQGFFRGVQRRIIM